MPHFFKSIYISSFSLSFSLSFFSPHSLLSLSLRKEAERRGGDPIAPSKTGPADTASDVGRWRGRDILLPDPRTISGSEEEEEEAEGAGVACIEDVLEDGWSGDEGVGADKGTASEALGPTTCDESAAPPALRAPADPPPAPLVALPPPLQPPVHATASLAGGPLLAETVEKGSCPDRPSPSLARRARNSWRHLRAHESCSTSPALGRREGSA